MKNHNLCVLAVVFLLMSAATARAQEFEEIDSEDAQRIAKQLSEQAAKIEKPQVKIDADPQNAFGLRFRKDGILIVPRKGLKEEGIPEGAKTETGAGFAFLFMTERFSPIVDGQNVDESKLRTVKLTDNQGNERTIKCLLLASRQISEDEWKLYVYGSDKKPLAESRFSSKETDTERPVSIKVEDVQGSEGTLKVTLFGKYQAEIQIGYNE